jgi:TRAP-type mannitol/chloroaromatic compound transport system permease small subunit
MRPLDTLLALARACDTVNDLIGRGARWLTVAMVLVQFAVVVLRYVYGTSYVWSQELVIYLHAGVFMLGAGYTLMRDGHVRVDVVYSEAPPRVKAAIDLAGTLLLLIPSCLVLLIFTWNFVARSWAILEGAMAIGGIPAVFLLKTLIPVFAGLLLLQGVALAIRAYARLVGRDVRPAAPHVAAGEGEG